MTKRKGETHAEYWVRRGGRKKVVTNPSQELFLDQSSPRWNPDPLPPSQVVFERAQKLFHQPNQDLHKKIAFLEGIIRKREADDREDQLRSSMKFKPLIMPGYKRRKSSSGTAMALWSDWHWGETVDIRETGGLNEFNERIAEQRVKNLVAGTLTLLKEHTGGIDDTLWVLLDGDMISGLIHEELVATNWGNIVEQCMGVGNAILGALVSLAAHFKHTVVVGIAGNHGRVTARPTAKGILDSYDRAVYHSLAKQLVGDRRFTIIVPDNIDYLFEVHGHRFLLTHGDRLGVKGGDGIIGAIGPIARGSVKLHNSEGQIGRDFDTLVLGHWHQYIPRSDALGVIVNGTLKGYDEFSRTVLRARFARPSQALWLVSPGHGIAAQWPVHVDARRLK